MRSSNHGELAMHRFWVTTWSEWVDVFETKPEDSVDYEDEGFSRIYAPDPASAIKRFNDERPYDCRDVVLLCDDIYEPTNTHPWMRFEKIGRADSYKLTEKLDPFAHYAAWDTED
jgi:hypothetical protein